MDTSVVRDTDNTLVEYSSPLSDSHGVSSDVSRTEITGPAKDGSDCDVLGRPHTEVFAGATQFSEERNPFLFPLDILASGEECRSHSPDFGAATSPAVSQTDFNPKDLSVARWWLVHTKPRQEKKLAEELLAMQIPHYLPVSLRKATTRGRVRTSQIPLFSGYFFLHVRPEDRERALKTNRIVATHLCSDEQRLVSQLWQVADLIEKGVPLTVESRISQGTWVRVRSGLLKNKEGEVLYRGGKTRLWVFVSDMLGGVSLEIEEHLLEPYGTAPPRPKRA